MKKKIIGQIILAERAAVRPRGKLIIILSRVERAYHARIASELRFSLWS